MFVLPTGVFLMRKSIGKNICTEKIYIIQPVDRIPWVLTEKGDDF